MLYAWPFQCWHPERRSDWRVGGSQSARRAVSRDTSDATSLSEYQNVIPSSSGPQSTNIYDVDYGFCSYFCFSGFNYDNFKFIY